ncbi:MAG: SPOR domain-containing protein [Bacteroidales bacterium]
MRTPTLKLFFFTFLLSLFLLPRITFAQVSIPADFKISERSKEIIDQINKYRKENNLPEIKISTSLCWVAYLHNEDLIHNQCDTADCTLSSWSDIDLWQGGCINQKNRNIKISRNKPKEICNYPSQGFELTFWQNTHPDTESVIKDWTSDNISRNIIINKGIWRNHEWNAIGASAIGNYVLVWFGSSIDPVHPVEISKAELNNWYYDIRKKAAAQKDSIKENQPTQKPEKVEIQDKKKKQSPEEEKKSNEKIKTNPNKDDLTAQKKQDHFLIIGTYSNEKEANALKDELIKTNYPNAGIIKSEDKFRIFLDKFATHDDAQKAKEKSSANFQGIWIFSKDKP